MSVSTACAFQFVIFVIVSNVECSDVRISAIQNDVIQEFNNFILKYNRSYSDHSEYQIRLDIFTQNMLLNDEKNKKEKLAGGTAIYGVTMFSDITEADFRIARGIAPMTRPKTAKYKEMPRLLASVATTFKDWRNILTTPIKNQGNCGSCWAFSAVEQVESDAMRTLGFSNSTLLSTQQVTSCVSCCGCDGGWTEDAFNYMTVFGLQLESAYPYTSGSSSETGVCDYKSDHVHVIPTNFYVIAPHQMDASKKEVIMKNYVLSVGPLSVCLDGSNFMAYTGGVIASCGCEINHCVQVVGINLKPASSPAYWIIRNQWGSEWGIKGYAYIKYGGNVCCLTDNPYYTVVKEKPMISCNVSTAQHKLVGNGWCDEDLNNADCGYDGGDCCESSCSIPRPFACGSNGYECIDPSYGPTSVPVLAPTSPTQLPSYIPSPKMPTLNPSKIPSSKTPSYFPTKMPNSRSPSPKPTIKPSSSYPISKPSAAPNTQTPSIMSLILKSKTPTRKPSRIPTRMPSSKPATKKLLRVEDVLCEHGKSAIIPPL